MPHLSRKLVRSLPLLLALTILIPVSRPARTHGQTIRPLATPDRGERLRLFDQVWRAVNESYYDGKFNGVDWRAQRQIYRPLAAMAPSRTELYAILRRMLGTLGDAHTRIYAPDESFDRYRPSGMTVGLQVRPVEGAPTVTWVEPDSEASAAGIRPGFRLLAIDELPVEQVLERIRRDLVSSSTVTALETQSFDRLLQLGQGSTLALRLADAKGLAREVTLSRRRVEYQRRAIPRQLPHRIGYIELTGFGQDVEYDFDMAMQQMQGTRGLILDLRNNGGGFVSSVLQIASYFFPEQTDLGEFITRDGKATRRLTGLARQTYRAPVLLLVSSRSASGAEILAAAMQEHRRATVVGTHPTTCGCLLGVSRTIRLADGGRLNVSDTDFRTPAGRRIEGRGIRPDMIVGVRVADLLQATDLPLQMAGDHLGRQIIFGRRSAEVDFSIRLPRLSGLNQGKD